MDFDFVNTTLALMQDWFEKYKNGVTEAFLISIQNKPLEVLLFREIFEKKKSVDKAIDNINLFYGIEKSQLDISLRFLTIDWSHYVNK